MATPVDMSFPRKGLIEGLAKENTPPGFTPKALNVTSFDVIEGKKRGGKRGGTRRVITLPLAGPVQRMRMVVLSSGTPLEETFVFDDPYPDLGSGPTGAGPGGGWLRPRPSYFPGDKWLPYDPVIDPETGELDEPDPNETEIPGQEAEIVDNFEYANGLLQTVSSGVWEKISGLTASNVSVASEQAVIERGGAFTGSATTVYRWHFPAGVIDFTKPYRIIVNIGNMEVSRDAITDPAQATAQFDIRILDLDSRTWIELATSLIFGTPFSRRRLNLRQFGETTQTDDQTGTSQSVSVSGEYTYNVEVSPETTKANAPGFAQLTTPSPGSRLAPELKFHFSTNGQISSVNAIIKLNSVKIIGQPV